ncbi:MAG: hypothetical protein IPO27_14850 [Bacteroidetes bacterium]|nr:hypothetical protein [Bacteroidota bacterium]
MQNKITEYKSKAKKNPPVSIYQYCYNGKKVFYVTSYCCDIPSELLDDNCNTLCYPDGGITGNGDGKCTDFFDKRSDEHLVWRDNR